MEKGPATFKKGSLEKLSKINWEELLFKYRLQIFFLLLGLIFLVFGIFIFKNDTKEKGIEIIETASTESEEVVVEIAGAVEKPGVYSLNNGDRVNDLFIVCGGLSVDANRGWVEMVINKASKLTDGQKIYIPFEDEQSDVLSAKNLGGEQTISTTFSNTQEGLVSINSASQKELESLSGIGPVYAQNIIEHRPYSTLEELVSKGALKNYVFEKIKNHVSVY